MVICHFAAQLQQKQFAGACFAERNQRMTG
jgi:hypothetical protein